MDSLACLNGELMPVDEARVPVWDRGFLFGDAVYEVLRIYRGRCWLEDEHMARLRKSLAALEFSLENLGPLTARLHRTITASGIAEATAYVHITRGVAPRDQAFPRPAVPPTELIVVRAHDDRTLAGLRDRGVAAISFPDLRWKRCDIKSTNLLANVLALEAARREGCFEAILIGSDGLISEATHTSVIWVRRGRLEGTPEGPGILPGMTRQLLLRLAAGIDQPFSEARVSLPELVEADEVILLGTSTEVVSVIEIDGRKIADGRPGPVARRLRTAYRESVERWLDRQPA